MINLFTTMQTSNKIPFYLLSSHFFPIYLHESIKTSYLSSFMQKTKINTALAIVVIASAVVLIGGLAVIPVLEQAAQAQSGTHSESCVKEQGPGNPGCVATIQNPSNPNSVCDTGREFGGNQSGVRGNC
jgi:hypothetical protein